MPNQFFNESETTLSMDEKYLLRFWNQKETVLKIQSPDWLLQEVQQVLKKLKCAEQTSSRFTKAQCEQIHIKALKMLNIVVKKYEQIKKKEEAIFVSDLIITQVDQRLRSMPDKSSSRYDPPRFL